MTSEQLQWLLVIVFFISMVSMVFTRITLRFTLDRRVRKALPTDKEYDGFFDGFCGLFRTALFANACIPFLKGAKKNMAIYYDGFDVDSFANRFEKVLAYIHFISFCTVILYVILFFITKWLGIFEWPDT